MVEVEVVVELSCGGDSVVEVSLWSMVDDAVVAIVEARKKLKAGFV